METQSKITTKTIHHPGPPLWLPAIMFAITFNTGLFFVTSFGGAPYFPGPWETVQVIQKFFLLRSDAVILCAFFQFGAAIPLGIFAVNAVSQLRFLGAKVAGTYIALFGGILTSMNIIASSMIMWAAAHPGIAQDANLINALYFLQFGFGGVGFSVPMGLLIAGISIPSLLMKLLPKWLCIFGIVLAVFGVFSWFDLVFPQALPLIPLTRFPGFIWFICVGFMLPNRRKEGIAS
jgi:hypothetical protein